MNQRIESQPFKTRKVPQSFGAVALLSLALTGPLPASATNPDCVTTSSTFTLSGVTYVAETIAAAGVCDFVVPTDVISIKALLVGGGGGGGGGASVEEGRGGGGGGGGGQVGVTSDLSVTPGTRHSVTVGAGGTRGAFGGGNSSPAGAGAQGGNTIFVGPGGPLGTDGGYGGGAGGATGGDGGDEGAFTYTGGVASSLQGGSGASGASNGSASASLTAGLSYTGFASAALTFSDGGGGAGASPSSPVPGVNPGAGGAGGVGAFATGDPLGFLGTSGKPGLVIIRYAITAPGQTGTPTASVSDTSVSLTWTAPTTSGGSPTTGYKVEQSIDAGVNWTVSVADTGSTTTSATVSSLTPGSSYLFRISALNLVGASTVSTASSSVSIASTVVAAPAPYQGPVFSQLSRLPLSEGEATELTLTGERLQEITAATVDGLTVEILSNSGTELKVRVPGLTGGLKNLELQLNLGRLSHQDAFLVSASPVFETEDIAKVNAGSFKGYVAVYAKGYEGKRLSAKIGNDWVIVNSLASNFERVTDFTGAGVSIAVRIYIDRVLIDTINLVTK